MSEVNIPLLRKMVEWVEEQDKLPVLEREWEQGEWVTDDNNLIAYNTTSYGQRNMMRIEANWCGTAYCIAGKIAADHMEADGLHLLDNDFLVDESGKEMCISDYAADKLGVFYDSRLFDAANTAEDVRRIAEYIAGEPL